jgi:prephenate dehydrogenase
MTTVNSVPFGAVHVIGAGLLGASCGLALRDRGVEVTLEDSSPSALSLAVDYGAGRKRDINDSEPDLVIVATPPDVTASVVIEALGRFHNAIVIDVASVKGVINHAIQSSGVDTSRYVPTHPMAGRERGGAVSARSDLFTARPWVICEGEPGAVAAVTAGIKALEATPVMMSVREHDTAVALISHAPQLVSSIMAARLSRASDEALSLAGGGIRDVTRIAAGDPTLWTHIVHANGEAIQAVLSEVRDDLDQVLNALEQASEAGSRKVIAGVLREGNQGVSRLPGKHGVSTRFASLLVVIDDKPGELARLLTQLGQWNVNLEDLRIEHSPGAPVGFVDLTLAKDSVSVVEEKLHAAGWRIAGEIE